MTQLRSGIAKLGRLVRVFLVSAFGRLQWDAPPWAKATVTRSQVFLAHPANAFASAAALVIVAASAAWYLTRPTPKYVTYEITPPGLTEYNNDGISSVKPLLITFSESAAPLKFVKRPVTEGVALSPEVPGTWFWLSDRELQFKPTDDWPVDGHFTVKLASRVLASQTTLKEYKFKFASQPFVATIASGQFYQDPVDPNLKKLVATVSFSHPVDTVPFESHVSLLVAKDAAYLGLAPNSRQFTVAYDKFRLNAYVHSVPLAMPRDDTPMTLRLDPGVRAARGGNGTPDRLETVVTIPGRASLRFSDARMAVVDNARYEPEQILFVQSSSPVAERAFDKKLEVRLLPERHPKQPKEDSEPYNWSNDVGIGEDILNRSSIVPAVYVPSDDAGNTSHGFRFRAPVGRYLHVLVRDNVEGTGGYISGKPYTDTVEVEPYPRALKFLGEGSLLAPSGDRKVGFLTRDIETVQVEIGRVLPNQLQHLGRAMSDFARPDLYDDLEDGLTERFVTTRDYSTSAPGKPTYDSIDLSQYLQDKTGERRGLFLLHVRATSLRASDAGESESEGGGLPEDTRLVLVTDLGFFVKRVKDGSRDVFVQSIRTGSPVSGARVALLGANGLAAFSATTDATGRASLPAPPQDTPREKMPQMVLVEKDSDLSFMPFRTLQRSLEVSRFDVGGVLNAESAQQLTSYLFSDRGIYRPGETAHLGLVTRSADWQSTLTGVPLTVEITDPRGQIVQRTQVPVSAAAFDELTYPAPSSAATGTYEAVAYLVKNDRQRESIGSTTFRVQEFEPDRLKVQLDLTAVATPPGWLRPDDVHARVTVAHLFGAAASGRRVEGELTLTPALPRFPKYADYRFQIGEALREPHHETLAATTTDAAGIAEFPLDLKRFVGRAYRLNVLSRAFEAEGGRNVAAQNSAIVSDATFLVGVKPDGDLTFVTRGASRQAHWLAVDQQLNPVAAANLSLEWVQKKFVSVLTQQQNGTLKYVSRLKETVRSSRTVSVAQGGSSFQLPTSEPGDFALVLRDASGAKLNSIGYTVAGDANLSRSLDRDAELQIQLDKSSYRGGETMAISIRAPYAGAGLITIERDRVYRHHWFKTSTTSSVQRVTLPENFEGNGYVTVQFVRDPSSNELFVSPLAYGVAPFGADLRSRTLALGITAPRVVKPGEDLTIHIKPGEASRVAVLAVDEGILQVARYRSPDPLGYFFQKKMLEVDTSQVLDLILPEYQRFLALAAPGGDTDAGFSRHLNPFARKRKAPAAFWSGIIDVGPQGRDITYTVPDYFNGRLRIVAIAVSARRVGVAEAGTDVRGDFILTPNLPATVTPGDEFVVSVGVYNNTTGGNGPVRLELKAGGGLTLLSGAGIDLAIADKKEGVGEFRLKANAVLGSAPLTFTARRAGAEASVEEAVGVRPASAFRTQLTLGTITSADVTTPITRDLFAERRKVEAAIATTPLVWGQGLVAYLDNYEYSCTEQLVSKGIGGLVVLSHPELGRLQSSGDQTLAPTFATIRARQNDQGGLGLWSSTPEVSEFATIYGAHFLIESKDRGQRIPQDVLDNLNGWLTRFAATPASSLEAGRLRAYAVYLLARQGIRPTVALSNVEQELTKRYPKVWTTDLAAAYLASTYKLLQRNADADRMVKTVPWSAGKRDFADEVYYSDVVHDAQLLYLLSRHFPALLTGTPPSTLQAMSASSLSAGYTLLGLEAYSKAAASSITLGVSEVAANGQVRVLSLPTGLLPKVAVAATAAKIQFSRKGSLPAYFVLAESGYDKAPPTAEKRQGLEIFREFIDASGNVLARVTVGQEFFVRIRVRSIDRDQARQIAVVDVLPGGIEPVLEVRPAANSSTPGADPAQQAPADAARALPVGLPEKSDWAPDHVDVREDRLILYGDATRSVRTFVYRVRANSAGLFKVPPAFAEGMYNRTLVALGPGTTIEVIKP